MNVERKSLVANPSGGHFSIDLGRPFESVTLTLTNLNGQLVRTEFYRQQQLLSLDIHEPAGVYLLQVQSGDKQAVIRLVKE